MNLELRCTRVLPAAGSAGCLPPALTMFTWSQTLFCAWLWLLMLLNT